MPLAIFDFDGTITTRDSFADFIVFTHGRLRTILCAIVLSPILFLFTLRLLGRSRTKEFVVTYFYRGWERVQLKSIAMHYVREQLPKIVKPTAMEKIAWHKSQGHKIVVVSASPEFYLAPWCHAQNIDLLATRIEFKDDKATGRLEGKNCHGEEKVRRLREKYDLSEFDRIYAYGDSAGDRALAAIATEFHYRLF